MLPDAAAAYARFLVVRSMPLLVVDLEEPEGETKPALEEGLFRALVERGLATVPRFYGEPLPKGARVGLTLGTEELRLEDEEETTLLRIPRASVDEEWEAEAKRLRGTMIYVGRNLDMDPDLAPKELCDLLDAAAGEGRIAGAIIGVAEPADGLPIFG